MPAARTPTGLWLLICHGNAGNLSEFDRPVHYAGLRGLGLSLLAFDYRGYGESGGSPGEQGLYRDADAAYRYLREERGVPADRIVLFGHSLGSAVAIDLASRVPAAGLIVEGALTSAVDRGRELYPYIPVGWIARSRFRSIDKLPAVSAPKLFLHATRDEVIPIRPRAAALRPRSPTQDVCRPWWRARGCLRSSTPAATSAASEPFSDRYRPTPHPDHPTPHPGRSEGSWNATAFGGVNWRSSPHWGRGPISL